MPDLVHCTPSLEEEKSREEEDGSCVCLLLHGLLQVLGFGLVSICSLLIWEMVEERMDKGGVVVVLSLEKLLVVVNLQV